MALFAPSLRTFILNPRLPTNLRFGNCFPLRRDSFSSAPSLRNSFLSPEFIFVCALHASSISHSPAFNQSFFFYFFSEIHFVCAPHIPSISFGPAISNSFFSLSSPEFNLVCALCASNLRSALSAAILPFFPSLLRIHCIICAPSQPSPHSVSSGPSPKPSPHAVSFGSLL